MLAAYDTPYRVFSIALLALCSIPVGTPILTVFAFCINPIKEQHLEVDQAGFRFSAPGAPDRPNR
jgi:hypothetical protein